MKELCNTYVDSEYINYLRNNVRFVIIPLCNPWGYVHQSYYNSRDVDLNKNFEFGYRNNGTEHTGTTAYSEAETVLMKGFLITIKMLYSIWNVMVNMEWILHLHRQYGLA